MYELMLLSLLMRFPTHGYILTKIISDTLGPWTRVSNGTLYPLLSRLEHAGLISVVEEEQGHGDRRARTFAITDEGRKRFHQLMLNTSDNQADYTRIFQHKVSYLYLLAPKERLHLINHYINYCQTQVLYYHAEMEDFRHECDPKAEPTFFENVLNAMHHRMTLSQAELEWAQEIRAREIQRIEQEGSPAGKGETAKGDLYADY